MFQFGSRTAFDESLSDQWCFSVKSKTDVKTSSRQNHPFSSINATRGICKQFDISQLNQ